MEGRGRGAQAVRQASTGSTASCSHPPQQHNPVPTPPRRTPIVPPSPKQSLPPTSPRCPRTRPPFLHLTPTSPCQPPHHHTPAQHCCYNKPAPLPKFHYRRALLHSHSWGFNALKKIIIKRRDQICSHCCLSSSVTGRHSRVK